jgi:AraC-like DNA-binding protein
MALNSSPNIPAVGDAARVIVARDNRYLSAVAGFQFHSGDGASYRSLPHAQFALTVHCDDDWDNRRCGATASVAIGLSGLSQNGGLFQSRGAGAVIIAFLKPRAFGLIHRGWRHIRGQVADAVSIFGNSCAREIASKARSRRPLAEKAKAIAHWLDLFCAESPTLAYDGQRAITAAEMLTEATGISVHQLAVFAGVSRRQLENDFVKWIGISPGQFRDAVRAEQTLAALATTESLSHIAAEHGFADQSHMTRMIRSRIGLTPLQIRQHAHHPAAEKIRAALAGRLSAIEALSASPPFENNAPHS